MTIREQIEKDLVNAFVKLKFDVTPAQISVSNLDNVDYQCNASFQIAKSIKKNPLDVASEIAKNFKSKVAICEVSKPAFLNFQVSDMALEKLAGEILTNGKIPLAKQKKRTVFFDYGGANVAKELHIGHLRPPIVGEALKRVFGSFGHKTVADTYLGDWGLQIGLVIAELELQKTKDITIEVLNEYYPRASKRKDTDPEFMKKAQEYTRQLQQLKEPYIGLWKKIRAVSVERIRENYERLNCTFDLYNGESHAQPFVDMVLKILEPHTYIDKDCLLIDVKNENENKPMPPVILKKGNGGDLYATSDVATIYYRQKDFNPDEYIYVTDFRQNLHFEQIFRVVKKGNIVPENTKFTHIGLGTISGKDGKSFRTRDGGTIRLEDVIGLVVDGAKKRLVESGRNADDETAERIGLSALKFADLVGNVKSGYIFDIEKFTDFNGKTGPYLLYTIARINSLLSKVGGEYKDVSAILSEVKNPASEAKRNIRNILSSVLKISDAYTTAAQNYTLNGIVEAVYNLASEFNSFYGNTNILKEKDANLKNLYIGICVLVKKTMEFVLDTLAIDIVESM